MWIGKANGLPMKIVVDYTNGVLKQMTVNYDTETPVTIERRPIELKWDRTETY